MFTTRGYIYMNVYLCIQETFDLISFCLFLTANYNITFFGFRYWQGSVRLWNIFLGRFRDVTIIALMIQKLLKNSQKVFFLLDINDWVFSIKIICGQITNFAVVEKQGFNYPQYIQPFERKESRSLALL